MPLAIFEPLGAPNRWKPSALAAGPFAGLQGGAVASLLTAEVEALAGVRKWGTAISASAWFLRPTPMADLRTRAFGSHRRRPRQRDRQYVWAGDEDQACATVRVTLSRERAVEISGFADEASETADPTRFPLRAGKAAHGRPWFMDAMEARKGDDVAWFRLGQDHRRRRPALHGFWTGRLDTWHFAAVPERRGRPQPEPDGAALPATGGRMGWRSRRNEVAAGCRPWSRERRVARPAW